MNLLEPSHAIFFVGFVVYLWTRHIYDKRARTEARSERRMDRTEMVLLPFVILSSLVLPVLFLLTPIFAFADYPLPKPISIVGVAVMVLALWLFWRSHDDLGTNWSKTLEIREGHELVSDGVYRSIRHPMYTSIFLFGICQGMLLQNWFVGWSALIAFSPLYLVRVGKEEAMMRDVFGSEYDAYMARTGRLLPKIFG